MFFIGNESIDLNLCLIESAQCFTWTRVGERYFGMLGNEPTALARKPDGIYAEGNASVREIRAFLDLDRDYGEIARSYAHIPAAKRAMEMYPGLRVLRQDPWDALLSFILSANNNVRRICNLSLALRKTFGAPGEVCGNAVYAYPSPQALADVDEASLRGLGMGYRAPYLVKTARMVRDGFDLYGLREMPYPQAHEKLTRLAGVGDKVADCVLLFGCGHTCAFPVDTWVEKLLRTWFAFPEMNRERLGCAAREMLGKNAGILQQFLFHAARTGDIEL